MCLFLHRIFIGCMVVFFSTSAGVFKGHAKEPIYKSFVTHQQASPILDVKNITQVVQRQEWLYKGEGPAPYSLNAKELIETWERYGIKGEYATTGLCLQQLKRDFPEVIEKIKSLKIPVTLYPGAGHVMPCPIGRLRETPAMRDLIFKAPAPRNRIRS